MERTAYQFAAAVLTAASVIVGCSTARAAERTGEPLMPADVAAFAMRGGESAAKSVVDVGGQSFSKAIAVNVRNKPSSEYGVQLVRAVDAPLAEGDVVLLTAWARLVATPDESGEARLGLVLEDPSDPAKLLQRVFGVGSAWQRIDVPLKVTKAYAAGTLNIAVRLGYYVQSVEIGSVSLQRFPAGTDLASLPHTRATYVGRSADAPWRVAAAARIEKIRKAPLVIDVVDAAGRPVAGATVHARMTRHAFAFGSVYNTNLVTGPLAVGPEAAVYREHFVKLFNTGVDELMEKWPWWEDPAHRRAALESVAWMRDHGIDLRGHVMVWPSWRKTPSELKSLADRPEALRKRVVDHIADIGAALKGSVAEWDVVNEPIKNNDLLNILGEGVMGDWFKAARRADPDARLYLNEAAVPNATPFDKRYDQFEHNIDVIQKTGAPIGGIGMQGHFGWTMNSPMQLLGIYDRFSKFGLPIRITELDIEVDDAELQHDYMRDVLTASFSHPSINGVLSWSFWAGASWKPKAALFDEAWKPTGAGRAWTELINGAWWTDVEGVADTNGRFECWGFLGNYEVTVREGGRTRSVDTVLASGGKPVRVEVGP